MRQIPLLLRHLFVLACRPQEGEVQKPVRNKENFSIYSKR